MNRLYQLLISLDQFLSCLVGLITGDAWADETFSSKCWRKGKVSKVWNTVRVIVDSLLWFDKQHCFTSYISEAERKQLPEEFRK